MENIVCFGDSITHGGHEVHEGCRWTAILQHELNALQPGRWAVWNRGVGGSTTGNALDRFAADVEPLLPAVVLLEFGFNDAHVPATQIHARCGMPEFEANLRQLIRKVRAGGGVAVVLTNHPIRQQRPDFLQGNGKDYVRNFKPYQNAIRRVAQQVRAPLIDLEAAMRRSGCGAEDLVGADGLHLTPVGNLPYARHVLQGLLPLLARFRRRGKT